MVALGCLAPAESDGRWQRGLLKKLNPSEEGVRLAEFVTVFSAPEMRAAVEAASAPPSWLSAVKDAPLFVDGEAKVRSEHGFKHFASEGRFEHTLAEWTDERIESLTSVQTELAQWRCDEKSRQTISADEYANLTKRQEEYLAANSAFPKADRDAEKAKVLANLEQRVALAYRPPSKDQMRRIKAPTSLSPPLGDISALPDQPHGTDAPGGGGGGGGGGADGGAGATSLPPSPPVSSPSDDGEPTSGGRGSARCDRRGGGGDARHPRRRGRGREQTASPRRPPLTWRRRRGGLGGCCCLVDWRTMKIRPTTRTTTSPCRPRPRPRPLEAQWLLLPL